MSGPRLPIAALRHAAVPLAAYYAVTLALPLANGAASAGARFGVHAVMVLVVPPVAIVLVCGFYAIARACLSATTKTDAWQLRRQTGCAADSRSLRGS